MDAEWKRNTQIFIGVIRSPPGEGLRPYPALQYGGKVA